MTKNERLKIVRKELRLSQRDFAEELGSKQATISSIERGDIVSISNRIKTMLHIVFNVNISWLETGKGKMFLKGESAFKKSDPKINRMKAKSDASSFLPLILLKPFKKSKINALT